MGGSGWLRVLVACVSLAAFAAAGRADDAHAPSFSLLDSDITIDSGATEGRASMLLKADNLDADRLTKPLGTIEDLKAPLPPPVDVTFAARELDHADNSRRWVLTVDIKGLPRNVTQKRYLSFPFDGQVVTLAYTVTNKSTATFAWSVKGPPAEVSLSAGDALEVGIGVQGVAATQVRILQTDLVEQSRKTPLEGGLTLCSQAAGACTDVGIDLAPNSSNRLWLRTNNNSAIVGKYAGTVTVGAAEKPDGDTFSLTIYGTTLWRQLLGVLVIVIGVVCAWIVTAWVQSRLNRAQALLPATLLADRVRALQQRLANAPPGTEAADRADIDAALQGLAQRLSVNSLDAGNFLPPSMPNPFKGAGPNLDGYKQFLAQATAQLALLDLLVEEGLAAVWRKIPPELNDQSRAALTVASRAIDGLAAADPAPALKDATAAIQNALAQLDPALAAAGGAPPPPGAQHFAIQPRSFEQLVIEIRNLSGIAWLVFGLLSAAVGVYVLIINNLGFGLPGDFFTCLLWGFGLPVSGQQLVQSTVGSVGTALGITVPKAS